MNGDQNGVANPNVGGGEGGEVGQGVVGGGVGEGGEGVNVVDLLIRVTQLVNFLRSAAIDIAVALTWLNDGLQAIGNLPGLAEKFTRTVMGIQVCFLQIQDSRGRILQAVIPLEAMFNAPVIEPYPEVMASVKQAHEVINTALVSIHGFLLVFVKAQVHFEAQAQIQYGLTFLHTALGECHQAFTVFEFLHHAYNWNWGEEQP